MFKVEQEDVLDNCIHCYEGTNMRLHVQCPDPEFSGLVKIFAICSPCRLQLERDLSNARIEADRLRGVSLEVYPDLAPEK